MVLMKRSSISELSGNKTLAQETKPAHLPAGPHVETQGRRRTWVTWDGPQASDEPKREADASDQGRGPLEGTGLPESALRSRRGEGMGALHLCMRLMGESSLSRQVCCTPFTFYLKV